MVFLVAVLSLLGIALGTPIGQLRDRLGDPLLVRPYAGASVASYLRSDDPSAVLTVAEKDGVVFWVEIARERPSAVRGASDGYGIALGDSTETIAAKRGKPPVVTMNTWMYPEDADQTATTIYQLDNTTIEAIKLIGTAPTRGLLPPPNVQTHLQESSGATYASAILDRSRNAAASVHFRDRYMTVHDCSLHDRTTTNERRDGKTYAIATASCGKTKRSFYFEIAHAQ